jgi:hypothetical protein
MNEEIYETLFLGIWWFGRVSHCAGLPAKNNIALLPFNEIYFKINYFGCWPLKHNRATSFTMLKSEIYKTLLIGKYFSPKHK